MDKQAGVITSVFYSKDGVVKDFIIAVNEYNRHMSVQGFKAVVFGVNNYFYLSDHSITILVLILNKK